MMGQWFDLSGDARLGSCATEGCGGQPTKRLEAGGVGSNYCSGCAAKITALPATALPDGLEVVLDRTIARLQKLDDYAGRPVWEQVLREELGVSFAQAQSALAAMRAEQTRVSMGWADTLNALETAEAQVKRLTEDNKALRERADQWDAWAEGLTPAEIGNGMAKREARIKALEEALRPFARVGDILELRAGNRPNSDDDPVTEWEDHRVGARRLTVGDFRRARLLLKEGGE